MHDSHRHDKSQRLTHHLGVEIKQQNCVYYDFELLYFKTVFNTRL